MECEPLFNSDDRPSPGMKEKATEAQAVKMVTWRMASVVWCWASRRASRTRSAEIPGRSWSKQVQVPRGGIRIHLYPLRAQIAQKLAAQHAQKLAAQHGGRPALASTVTMNPVARVVSMRRGGPRLSHEHSRVHAQVAEATRLRHDRHSPESDLLSGKPSHVYLVFEEVTSGSEWGVLLRSPTHSNASSPMHDGKFLFK